MFQRFKRAGVKKKWFQLFKRAGVTERERIRNKEGNRGSTSILHIALGTWRLLSRSRLLEQVECWYFLTSHIESAQKIPM